MVKKRCIACGKEVWHNSCDKDGKGYRCTYCAHPVGTGPKRDGHAWVHEQQIRKVRLG